MGIISSFTATHVHATNLNRIRNRRHKPTTRLIGPADSNSIAIKWQAMIRQEKQYLLDYKVNLSEYRITYDSNSWNSTVLGYLKP